jgi:hypothetical protein
MSPRAVENWDAFGCANGTLARAVVAVGPHLVPLIVPMYQEVNNLVVSAECNQLGWLSPRIGKPYDPGP